MGSKLGHLDSYYVPTSSQLIAQAHAGHGSLPGRAQPTMSASSQIALLADGCYEDYSFDILCYAYRPRSSSYLQNDGSDLTHVVNISVLLSTKGYLPGRSAAVRLALPLRSLLLAGDGGMKWRKVDNVE